MKEQDYLYIFAHLHKTGGTTLNKHIEKNFKKDEVLFLYYNKLNIDPFTSKKPNYQKLARDAILKLSHEQRKKIKVISGHFLPKGIEKYFDPKKEVRYITIVRDPYDRAKSFYNYFRTLLEREDEKGKKKKLYKTFLKIGNTIPNFDAWIKQKYGKMQSGIVPHPANVYFRDLGYKLSDFYFIGVTKKLDEDLPFMFHFLGIRKYFIKQNVSKNFVKNNNSKSYFVKKYKKSINLYKKSLKINTDFKKDYKNFNKIVKRVRICQRIITPFTQIFFDFVESLRILSSLMRKKSRIYNNLMNFLKENGIL